ncbi:hypothetical protein GBAR_LOCUS18056 [Geodia barretti]|uniref:Ig-like domain-containing protein n=1 Tax=Geodia barretti TaxID=519541 RepID=A0AA35WT68_GEOBA|nr:hypothetical protein GBAR_LOCUS18056 [Geodia barretti]
MELLRSLRGGDILVWFLLAAVGTRAIHTPQLDDAPWWVGDDWNASIPLYDRLERNEDDPPIRDRVGGNISSWSADGKAVTEIDQSVVDTHLNERGTNETEHGYLIFGSDFPHVVNKHPPVKAINGEPFTMRCPIESSLPGTLYYWQRYKAMDRETQFGFPPDVEFSEGGRVWSVDVLSRDHNGMYECLAVNHIGHAVFHNANDFFISVLSCSNHAPTISFTIEHLGSSAHYEGDHVELKCTATAVDYHEQPFWYHNGTVCKNPTYYLVNSNFDVSACRWTSTLKVLNLTAETAGVYDCTVGLQGTNTTLVLAEPASEETEVTVAVVVGVGIAMGVGFAMVVMGLYYKNGTHNGPQPSEEPPCKDNQLQF